MCCEVHALSRGIMSETRLTYISGKILSFSALVCQRQKAAFLAFSIIKKEKNALHSFEKRPFEKHLGGIKKIM